MWGRLDEAIRLNKKAFAADSTWIWSLMRNAWNYAMLDNYTHAFRELEEASRRNAEMPASAMKTLAGYYVHFN
jgi:hypothetical protein